MPPAEATDVITQLIQSMGPVGALIAWLIWQDWKQTKRQQEPPPACSVAVEDALRKLTEQVDRTAAAAERAAKASESAIRVVEQLAQSDHYEHKELSAALARIEAQ